MRLRNFAVLLVLASSVIPKAFSQQGGLCCEGQAETIEQALQRHHVALTQKALVAALRNPDREVRTLAAQKLADDGAKDAIPSLIEALRAETVPLNRVNIATSLALLGDERGLATLKGICNDPGVSGYVRMDAARHVLDRHDDYCRDAVIRELQSGDDPDGLINAMHLTFRFARLSEDDSRRIFDLVVKALSDQTPGVRMAASNTLGRLGNVAAIPHLHEALAKEEVDGCRLEMQMDLERLQKQEHSR
jgi:HEAT repeat protein